MFGQISLGKWGLIVGGSLTLMGFVAYAFGNATLNLAGLFYGVPVLLGGLALKAAELKPIPYSQNTPPEVLTLREQQATPILNQLRKNVTRYRYGHEAHLDESLERLGLSPTDEERPVLHSIRETEVDGSYALVMEFDSPFISLETWQERKEKMEKFFGPGVRADLTHPKEDRINVFLITTSAEQTAPAEQAS
ncbi:MAG: hypothetical protein BRC46_09915 [Cyanobacteria bacterium QS_6_48_18]|nr:MAG: hypothetical protein BRC46_09915 [Cyanobacteria bacterium QS_6_48_18]